MSKAVPVSEWLSARAELLKEEHAAFDLLDSIMAKRRQLPMVKVNDPSRFKYETPDGTKLSLLDLFHGRRQLIIYHMMLYDNVENPCEWCSYNLDDIPSHLEHLNSRETSFVAVAPASLNKITKTKEQMGWTFPFYSSKDTIADAEAEKEELSWKSGSTFNTGYAAFYRDGDDVFHTYSMADRGESVLPTIGLLDMTKLGRQDDGEAKPFPLRVKTEA